MIETALSQQLSQQAAEAASKGFIRLLTSDYPKRKFAELKFLIDKGLPTYLRAQSYRCERVKTLLSRNDPVLLSESYVSPNFSSRNTKYSSKEFLDHLANGTNAIIVSGQAGSGKSTFLKYTFTEVIERGDTFYPIFLELRRINSNKSGKKVLFNEILQSVQEYCPGFTSHLLQFGLERGAYYLLLDGYDELDPDIRNEVSDEIEHFAAAYQDCKILMTSRPSKDLESWSSFEFANIEPFTLEQCVSYVRKLPFDEEQKAAFVHDLTDSLFEENRAFLSNPLLTAMMLLTYSTYGEIPNKRHVFYEKCFDVLSREHDALKGRYQRQLFSNLQIEKLQEVFTFLCVLSYRKRKFRFSLEELEKFVDSAKKAASTDASTSTLIQDFNESISILLRDGTEYEFVHRSFQEYFYAKFVIDDRKLKLSDKIDGLMSGYLDEDIIGMIFDMDTAYFEEGYLLPELIKLWSSLQKIDPKKNPAGILAKCFSNLTVRPDEDGKPSLSLVISNTKFFFLFNQFRSPRYADELGIRQESFWPSSTDQEKVIEKINLEFGGEVKIHHTNNKRLLELGFDLVAKRRKESIESLIKLLKRRKSDRTDVMLEAFDAKYLAST